MKNEIEVCPHCTQVFEQSAPTWTDVTPTEPGRYWFKINHDHLNVEPEIVNLSYPPNDSNLSVKSPYGSNNFTFLDIRRYVSGNVLWYGPLRMPVDEI